MSPVREPIRLSKGFLTVKSPSRNYRIITGTRSPDLSVPKVVTSVAGPLGGNGVSPRTNEVSRS